MLTLTHFDNTFFVMVTLNKLIPCLLQHGEEGYVIVDVSVRELTVLIGSSDDPDLTILLGRWTLPADITCMDAECTGSVLGADTVADCQLRVVVSLADGVVLYRELGVTHRVGADYSGLSECGRLQCPVTIVHLCPGFVLASSGAETALFFSANGVCGGHPAEWIKVTVDLESVQLQESFFPINRADTFTTWRSSPTCAVVVHAGLVSSVRKGEVAVSDQCTVLLGCVDGTVWWLASPLRSAVLQLHASHGALGAQTEPIIVQAQLWETFPRCVVRLLLRCVEEATTDCTRDIVARAVTEQKEALHGSACHTLTVVEENGLCTVLSMPVDWGGGQMRWKQRKVLAMYQLPISAVLAGIQELHGVLLCVCEATGALLACYPQQSGRSGDKGGSAVCVPITSARSPFVDAFAVVMRDSGAISGGTAVKGSILLSTPVGVLACPFLRPAASRDEARPSQRVVEALRAACGGDSRPHPFGLYRVPEEGSLSTEPVFEGFSPFSPTAAALLYSPAAVPAQDCASVAQSLGEQLTATHRQLAALQTEGQALDCELLRATALLDVLGDDRTGLQLHTPDSLRAPAATGPVTAGASLIAAKSLFEWSPAHINRTRSVSCRYRFRREPTSTTCTTFYGDHSSGTVTATYLDLQVTAHSLVAMRALRGRTVLFSLQSANATTSLHCSNSVHSVNIMLHEDAGGTTYTFLHTFPADDLAQLCSYRLLLSVIVEGPDGGLGSKNAHSGDASNDVLLSLLNVMLPLSDLLPVVTSSAAYRSAQQLSALQEQQNGPSQERPSSQVRGSIGTPSHADASAALHSLTLPAIPSSHQSGRVLAEDRTLRDAVIARWQQSAAAVQREQIFSSSQEKGANGNPLQAAFLRNGNITASSLTAAQEASARDILLQVTTKKETGSQTAHSMHRSVLAAVSAELHSSLLAQLPSPSTAAAPRASAVDQPSSGASTAQNGFHDATDSAWLPTAAQQALVAAAHLARQCSDGSEGLEPGIKEESLQAPAAVHDVERAVEEVWRLYQIARQV